jgi:hypothetical protein
MRGAGSLLELLRTSSPGFSTGKNTTEMKQIKTYTEMEPGVLDEKWNIDELFPGEPPNLDRIWNIVEGETYPFLSRQP